MSQALGIIDIFVNGTKMEVQPGGTLKLGGFVNAPQIAGGSVHRARKMEMSEVSFKMSLLRGQLVSDLIPDGELEVQCHCDTGQIYTGENFFRQNALTISAGESGGVDVVLVGGEMLGMVE